MQIKYKNVPHLFEKRNKSSYTFFWLVVEIFSQTEIIANSQLINSLIRLMPVSWNSNMYHTIERSNCMNVKLRNKGFMREDVFVVELGKNLIFNSSLFPLGKKKKPRIISSLKKGCFSVLFLNLSFLLSAGELLSDRQHSLHRPVSACHSQLASAGLLPIWVNSLLKWVTEADTAGIPSSTWLESSISIHVWQ